MIDENPSERTWRYFRSLRSEPRFQFPISDFNSAAIYIIQHNHPAKSKDLTSKRAQRKAKNRVLVVNCECIRSVSSLSMHSMPLIFAECALRVDHLIMGAIIQVPFVVIDGTYRFRYTIHNITLLFVS
jgi:hypothetical protein